MIRFAFHFAFMRVVRETIKKTFIIAVGVACLWTLTGMAHAAHLNEDAVSDRPFTTNATEAARLEEAMKPFVEKAKESYPQAKEQFLAGLAPGHWFFVTARLRDRAGVEQVFIAVQKIEAEFITGRISSDIFVVKGYKYGDLYTFPEAELIDWVIVNPDGTQEGNVVGKFLDEYHGRLKATEKGAAPDRQEPSR